MTAPDARREAAAKALYELTDTYTDGYWDAWETTDEEVRQQWRDNLDKIVPAEQHELLDKHAGVNRLALAMLLADVGGDADDQRVRSTVRLWQTNVVIHSSYYRRAQLLIAADERLRVKREV